MQQMSGIVLKELGQIPELKPLHMTDPGPNEVLVRMVASGICHTDIGYMQYARTCPVLLGHEGAGIVESIGADIQHVNPGDHVVINWQPKCRTCPQCLRGRSDLCENIHHTEEPRLFDNGNPMSVMLNAGTFAPYVIVREAGVIPIRKDMPLDKASLLGCGVATGVGAVLYTARVQPGQDVIVWGAGGGVGLSVVQGARLANAGRVIAIDLDDNRLQLAKKLGATHTLNIQAADPLDQVDQITQGRGVDHLFEVVGLPDVMQQGITMLARGGALTLIGAAGRQDDLVFKPRRFMSMQQTIQGCIFGNVRPEIDIPLFADWYMDGRLQLDDYHTYTVQLDQVPDIFQQHQAGHAEGIRTIIQFTDTANT
jgi:S-(hydroxymethyl)glutathione dehydrogenase/alcohol dehydrogenase